MDTVDSGVSYTLPQNVENLTLGFQDLVGTGNALDNYFTVGGTGNTLIGVAGNDTYVVPTYTDATLIENPNEGVDLVLAYRTVTLSANIENLTLGGSAAINGTGNELANVLVGNGGNNVLKGAAGSDTIDGAAGNDTLEGGAGNDRIDGAAGNDTFDGGAGNDRIDGGSGTDTAVFADATSAVTASLVSGTATGGYGNDTLTGVENLIGSAFGDLLTGDAGANNLDELRTWVDSLVEWGGRRHLSVVDMSTDVVTELARKVVDIVQTSASYVMPANIEELVIIGNTSVEVFGNELANTMTANGGLDTVHGGGGNDRIYGSFSADVLDGGPGADFMGGVGGNDLYIVDDVLDIISQPDFSSGYETVQSSVTYTLVQYLNALVLTGSNPINATGNPQHNVLTGNSANNVLEGGAGYDTLDGGNGVDTATYEHETSAVIVSLATGQSQEGYGVDTLISIENLVGSAFADQLTGNSFANRLDGGLGADTLLGGLGDDTYVVDSASDVVTEAAGAGNDQVESSLSYTLGANLENLTLTGTALNGTGNDGNNVLVGDGQDNILDGRAGNDQIEGGAGGDTASYASATAGVTVSLSSGLALGGAGNDTLTGIENLVGSGFDDILTGDAGANVLSAGAGADSLDGGAGADTLNGGAGADTYWVDNVSDLVIDASGADMDTVNASVSFSLAQFLDKLVLTGSASINGVGNELGNVIDGNASTNALDGGGGNDTLIGHAGNDTLTGGTGVDNFVMNAADSGMDRITDLAIGDRIQIVQGVRCPVFGLCDQWLGCECRAEPSSGAVISRHHDALCRA